MPVPFARAASALALTLFLAPQALAQSKPAPATLRAAVQPIANFTPMIVARDKGYFADEGLTVTWSNVPQGAIAVEAVFGGSAEIGASSMFEPMVARGNGLDMVFVAASTTIRPTAPDNSGLVVRTEDTIKGAKDLVGKKVSAGLLNSVNHAHIQEWLAKNGVDPKSVQFLELPFPQMPDALTQGRLDAVWAVEPFLTFIVQSGKGRVIAYPYQDNVPGMDISHYFAKESWVKANPELARRFRRAIDKASQFMIDAPKAERDGWIVKWSGLKPEVAAAVNLPVFTTKFNAASLKANLDIAVKQKLVKQGFDVDAMIWKP